MQTSQSQLSVNQPSFPFDRLQKIEFTISAAATLIEALSAERDDLISQLDSMTKPQRKPDTAPKYIWAGSFLYKGKLTSCFSFINAYQAALASLFTDFPEKRLEMARAGQALGHTRQYISQERNDLFQGKSQEFTNKYSRSIVDGWFFDTNLNVERMRRILPRLAAVVGLKWGADIKVYWRRETVPVDL